MNTYRVLLQNPTNKIKFCMFLRDLGIGLKDAVKHYDKFIKADREMANANLAKKSHFENMTEAVNFVYDCVTPAGYIMPDCLWPGLNTEQALRVNLELDKNTYLVVNFYQFQSGRVECVAYLT